MVALVIVADDDYRARPTYSSQISNITFSNLVVVVETAATQWPLRLEAVVPRRSQEAARALREPLLVELPEDTPRERRAAKLRDQRRTFRLMVAGHYPRPRPVDRPGEPAVGGKRRRWTARALKAKV